ncbi:MAG: hypothetical protein AB9891_13565 [Anaerolineaceae bacterium]
MAVEIEPESDLETSLTAFRIVSIHQPEKSGCVNLNSLTVPLNLRGTIYFPIPLQTVEISHQATCLALPHEGLLSDNGIRLKAASPVRDLTQF